MFLSISRSVAAGRGGDVVSKKMFFANKSYLLFCIDLDHGIMIFFDFFVIFSKTASLLLAADEPNSRFLASAAITGPSVCRQPDHTIG